MEKKMEQICEIKNRLIGTLDAASLNDATSVEVMGELVDMVKDMYEAEEKCWKACYYKKIVEAMKKEEKEGGNERFGYDNWRYPSSGRFAPTGSGQRYGFMPMDMDDIWDPDRRVYMNGMGPYGYRDGGSGNDNSSNQGSYNYSGSSNGSSGSRSRTGRYGYPMDDRHGDSYNRYNDARKYYTETGDVNAKMEMENHAKMHMKEVSETVHDIWDHASPDMKKSLKSELSNLVATLPA